MTKANLLKKLFSSFKQDDKESFYKFATELNKAWSVRRIMEYLLMI